ncbi:O-methyltransferase [Botrytis cinerea]
MDLEMTKRQNEAIRASLAELTSTVEKHLSACEENALNGSASTAASMSKTHVELMSAARKMKSDVYGPVNNVASHYEEFIHSGCLRALLEAGVFDKLPLDGKGMSASELAGKTNMEEALLIRMMRTVAPLYFEEHSPRVYNQTANSLIFQLEDMRSSYKQIYDEYAPCSYALTPYFKENGFKVPDSINNNPYTFAHRTNGLSMWDFLSLHPERLRIFNLGMNRISSQMVPSYGIFPWLSEYRKMETSEDAVLLVDIGGGQGQAIAAIRDIIEGTKGRLILQDREEVMLENPDPIPGVEKMTYDFFTPQPVKNALIYHIRRCFHDWPDADCVAILSNIANAMTSTSRLLIAEMVLQDELDAEAAWMDITMMFFAGKERSENQWRRLIGAAGMRLERIHGSEGTTFSVLEARLK